jgi:hypothetical protein
MPNSPKIRDYRRENQAWQRAKLLSRKLIEIKFSPWSERPEPYPYR